MKQFKDLFDIEQIQIIQSNEKNVLFDSVTHSNTLIEFPIILKYETHNIEVFRICDFDDSLRFIDIPINEQLADIVSNIDTFQVYKKQLLLNGKVIDNIPDRIIKCCGMYTEIKLRLFFEKTNIPEKFNVNYVCYMISDNELRKQLIRSGTFIDNDLIYSGGVIQKIKSD